MIDFGNSIEITDSDTEDVKKVKDAIKIKRDLLVSLKQTETLIKSSLSEDVKLHQSLCKHKFKAEREPYERTIHRCIYCGFF